MNCYALALHLGIQPPQCFLNQTSGRKLRLGGIKEWFWVSHMACNFNLMWFINRHCCGFCGCWQTLLLYEAAAFCRWDVLTSINGCLGHKQNFITDVIYLDWQGAWKSLLLSFCTPVGRSCFLAALEVVSLSANDSQCNSFLFKKFHQEAFLSMGKITIFASHFLRNRQRNLV